MTKTTATLLIASGLLCFVSARNVSAQVVMISQFQAKGDGITAIADCQTQASAAGGTASTSKLYAGLSAVCTVTTDDGTPVQMANTTVDANGNPTTTYIDVSSSISQPQCYLNPTLNSNNAENGVLATKQYTLTTASNVADCRWNFLVHPGTVYTLTSTHYIWVSAVPCGNGGAGTDCEASDPQNYLGYSQKGNDFPSTQLLETKEAPPGAPICNQPSDPSVCGHVGLPDLLYR